MKTKLSFILFLFTCFYGKLEAQVLNVFDDTSYQLGKYMEIYSDPTSLVGMDELLSGDFKFEKSENQIPVFSKDGGYAWCRFRLKNHSSKPIYLLVKNPNIDTVFLYSVKNNEVVNLDQNGEDFLFRFRKIRSMNLIFPILPGQEENTTFYLRLHITNSKQFPIIVSTNSVAETEIMNYNLLTGLFYGIVLMMILYNLLIWIKIREAAIPYFIIYLVFLALFISYTDGFAYKYLWPNFPALNRYIGILPALAGVFSILFMNNFLKLKARNPLFHKIAIGFIFLAAGAIAWNLSGSRYNSLDFIQFVVNIGCLCYIYLGYYFWKKGIRQAKYYLIAWICLALFVLIFNFKQFGYIPYNFFSHNALKIGALVQVLILGLAFGDSISTLMDNMKMLYLKRKKLHKELDSMVEERVKRKMVDLEEKNDFKNKVISVISHDLKSPVNALQMVLGLLESNNLSQQEATDLMDKIKGQVAESGKLIENVLSWSGKQVRGFELNKENHHISLLIEAEKNSFELSTNVKNITLTDLTDKELVCKIDKDIFQLILRNLLANAIKFSPVNSEIIINSHLEGNSLVTSVTDKGIGIPAEKIPIIFDFSKNYSTLGTSAETGSGLGLKLSYEFAKRHGGTIKIESIQGKGSVFSFILLTN